MSRVKATNLLEAWEGKDSGLPTPECRLGLTHDQVTELFGDRIGEFHRWMWGQTVGLCEGRRWNRETKQYEPSGCGPHGAAYYRSDVRRFLAGLPVID